jgi:CRP-like cAMP-binding protein
MNSVLPHFTADEIGILKQYARVVYVKSNHVLFRENDETDNVYFIESGHVKHYHTTALGKVVIVSICGPSEIIGVPAVILGKRRGVFAETLDRCTLWLIEKTTFLSILYQYPQLAIKLAAINCQLVRNYEYGLQALVAANADGRLAWLILRMANNTVQESKEGKYFIDFLLTHQEMADIIGSCRQTVTSTLSNFKKAGLIRVRKNSLEITDIEKLQQIVS